jgi:tetratricopeptide (TPR) repeat protein
VRGLGARSAIGLGVALLLAVSMALPGVAARYEAAAYDASAQGSTQLAMDRLDQAAKLNFLSAEPLLAKGAIALRAGSIPLAAESFEEAIGREPDNWLARFELGMLLARQGRAAEAEREVIAARRLNPRQEQVGEVLARIERGKPVDPVVINEELGSSLSSKLRPLARTPG